jgi:hypothetical protein
VSQNARRVDYKLVHWHLFVLLLLHRRLCNASILHLDLLRRRAATALFLSIALLQFGWVFLLDGLNSLLGLVFAPGVVVHTSVVLHRQGRFLVRKLELAR